MKTQGFFAIVLSCMAGLACAATGAVWRCGADGRTYSDQPCTGGQVVSVADERSDLQRSQGRDAARRDERLLARLEAERHERERAWAARGNGLTGIKPLVAVSERPTGAEASAKRPSKRPSRPSASGTSKKADRASRRGRG